jgi:hypothetical protein
MKLTLIGTLASSLCFLVPGIGLAQGPAATILAPADHEDKTSTVSIIDYNHSRQAEYFRDLTAQEQALADCYESIAALYKETPPQGIGLATATEMENHYRRLAEIHRKAATTTGHLAEYHDQLAKAIRVPRHATPTFSSFGK